MPGLPGERQPGGPLQLLFVSSDKFPPFRVDVAVLFGKEFAARGHRIDWVLQSEQPCELPFETDWSGHHVWVGATDSRPSRTAKARKYLLGMVHSLRVTRLMLQNDYDFVQVKDKAIVAALLTLLLGRLLKKRVFYWLSYPFPEASFHAVVEKETKYPFFYLLRSAFYSLVVYQVIMKAADHVFVQSEQMKRDVIAKGIRATKITPVPMGISLEMLGAVSAQDEAEGAGSDEKAVVYLGTLIRARRLDFLIRVFARVLEDEPATRLYLVGGAEDPGDVGVLRDEAARLGITGAVVFSGFLPRAEAFRIVRRARVCVSPFYPTPILNSTSPTKLVEYMALGKCVVANDHPEQRLVIEESGAGLCVPYEEGAFAEAIVRLLRDPLLAAKMGALGRAYVCEQRDYRSIAETLEATYRRLCHKGQ
jgi:glycosyltransferase involved in cell wall biosynthesis